MEIDFKPKYYGSMVRVSVTTAKGGIEYTIHLEDVDAIPIEWIEKWYRRALDNSGFMGDETISVGDLLSDWEKENEESSNSD